MKALEVEVDITPDGALVNAQLPPSCRSWFGSRAKVIIILPEANDAAEQRRQRLAKWQALLKETQALPQAQGITDADIAAEIDAHRRGA